MLSFREECFFLKNLKVLKVIDPYLQFLGGKCEPGNTGTENPLLMIAPVESENYFKKNGYIKEEITTNIYFEY